MVNLRSFTGPLWGIFGGNLLLLICIVFYLAWWIVTFRPNSASGGPAGTLSIMAAFLTGTAAIILLSNGINLLSQDSKGVPVKFIILGTAVMFFILLLVTSAVFHRAVTSELMIIHVWVAMELSAATVLYGTGRFGAGPAAILAALVAIAFIASMICYVLYYRLNETESYRVGMVPLIAAAFVVAVFLAEMARDNLHTGW